MIAQFFHRSYFAAFLFSIILIILLTVSTPISVQAYDSPVTVWMDGTQIDFDQPPVIVNGRTLIPVRAVAEQMGGTVVWDASDSTVHIDLGEHFFLFTIGDTTAYLNGAPHQLDTPPQIIGDRTLMPIRFLAESAGYTVAWDDSLRAVAILSEEPPLYSVDMQQSSQIFQNNLDGYRLTVPSAWQVDVSMPQVRTLFQSEQVSLEIYRQDTGSLAGTQAYVQYSNRAIRQNPSRFRILSDKLISDCALPCTYLEWYRAPLARIPNDKNYSCKADFAQGDVVYTLLFQSSVPMSDSVASIIHSFSPIPATYSAEQISMDKTHGNAHITNQETATYFSNTFGWDAPLTWGVFEPTYRTTHLPLNTIESAVNHHFPILLTYTGISPYYNPETVGDFLRRAWAEGRVVELTLQDAPDGGNDMCYDVLNGVYDDFLTDYAKDVAKFGHPVLLRLFNEMNGDWCAYSAYQMGLDADLSRALYQYVAGFFERAGADNVLYIFNPNGTSLPNYKWNHPLLYYPGDEYADIWGITAYNTGTYYPDETWQSFDELYRDLCIQTQKYTDMPIMITEFACAREGGDKAAWVEDMLSAIHQYPAIKVAVWWDHADFDGENIARAYYMLDSEELVGIWKNYFSAP